MRDRSIAIWVAAFVCACGPTSHSNNGGDDDGDVDANTGGGGGGGGGGSTVDALGCSKMDLLFVIDNSGSMQQEQTNLIANFPTFISVLDASGLDYRVAVTTTARNYNYTMTVPILGNQPQSTTGESGAMLKKGAMTKRWIDKGDQDVTGTFATLANVGVGGSADEMPLGAVRDAFEDRMQDNTNMGFRRSDALLGIVILTDENDCSYEASVTLPFGQSLCSSMMEPVGNYKAFLDQYTGSPTRWAAAIIAGPGPGTCSSGFGDADEATRLIDFKSQVGANAIMSSICDGNLSMGLGQALMLFQSACGGIIL